jgi:hypothetical protein
MIGPVLARVGELVTLEGYAQDFGHAVSEVQFSGDDGCTWSTYPLSDIDPDRNVNWSFSFMPEQVGLHKILIRAVSGNSRTTPTPASVQVIVED